MRLISPDLALDVCWIQFINVPSSSPVANQLQSISGMRSDCSQFQLTITQAGTNWISCKNSKLLSIITSSEGGGWHIQKIEYWYFILSTILRMWLSFLGPKLGGCFIPASLRSHPLPIFPSQRHQGGIKKAKFKSLVSNKYEQQIY